MRYESTKTVAELVVGIFRFLTERKDGANMDQLIQKFPDFDVDVVDDVVWAMKENGTLRVSREFEGGDYFILVPDAEVA